MYPQIENKQIIETQNYGSEVKELIKDTQDQLLTMFMEINNFDEKSKEIVMNNTRLSDFIQHDLQQNKEGICNIFNQCLLEKNT